VERTSFPSLPIPITTGRTTLRPTEALNNKTQDLRSTFYCKPNGVIDNNQNTSVDFYTADAQTSYSVVIEGVGLNCDIGRANAEQRVQNHLYATGNWRFRLNYVSFVSV